MIEVTAAVATGAGKPFDLQRLRLDDPRDDEVLVRITGVGVCHTDLVFKEGEMIAPPAVLGHEGAGVVEAVGSAVSGFAPGDRVAISFRSCGQCRNCGHGDAAYCQTMPLLNYAGMRPDGSKALHGADGDVGSNFFGQSSFATHALTYARNLVKVPTDARLSMKPGITGLWQVSGRSNLSFEEWMRMDLEYLDRWSNFEDLRLLALTIPAVIVGRGAK